MIPLYITTGIIIGVSITMYIKQSLHSSIYYKGYEQGLKDCTAILGKRDIDDDEVWRVYARAQRLMKERYV